MIPARTGAVLFVLFVNPFITFAQSPEQVTKYRLVQSYEQSGDFPNAAKQYKELLTSEPSNFLYFDGLRRMYMQLKQYDDAIALLSGRLVGNPGDINMRGMLGSAYYKSGNDREAYAEWDRAIAFEPSNPNVYRAIANIMLENRLLDKTAELYRKARIACNDLNLFTIDLAQLLAISMDYEGSTQEYLRWLQQNPTQLTFVQSRMASFTGKEEGRAAALQVVRNELKSNGSQRLQELLAWLYLEGRNFEAAFEVYRTIDRLTRGQGATIYAFAERAFKERAFDVAAKGYLEAINTPISTTRLPYAQFGYACTLKELSILADTSSGVSVLSSVPSTESQPVYAGAIAYFRKIIEEYPHTEFAAKSYYQIGTMQFERYFDLDGAIHSLEKVESELPGLSVIVFDVSLKIGQVHVAKGDTAAAAVRFRKVIDASHATPDQQDEASYRLAELDYFGGKIDEAINRLGEISINLKADYANDALVLLSFLQENKSTAEAALKDFARADFLARQRKNTEAIPLFQRVINQYPQALLIDDALMKVATLQAQARLYADAIASYQRLLTEFKESSIALDKAQFSMGEIYQRELKDAQKAIAAYEKVLAEHPQSLLVTEARKRIRELRGDSM